MSLEGILGSLGGLSLFLYGMKILNSVLQTLSDQRLKNILRKASKNKIIGAFIGTFVSALLQSSSGTTVMIVSLVNSGLLSLQGAVPLIMGANIGTTITAQIVAFKITQYAPLLLFIATLGLLVVRSPRVRKIFEMICGVSMIFFGMDIMSKSIALLNTSLAFTNTVSSIGNNWMLAIVAGTILTAIIQSSSTGVAIIQAMAVNRLIILPHAIPILLGQNIGTCSTALLSSLGGSKRGAQAAFIHLLFNLIGVLVFLPFMSILSDFVEYIEPHNAARQVAHAHTLFNLISTIVLLPFSSIFAKVALKILKTSR